MRMLIASFDVVIRRRQGNGYFFHLGRYDRSCIQKLEANVH